jgi:hypothetical protein
VNLLLAESVVAQVIQTGIREPRIERAQLREIKRIVLPVVGASQESHQAAGPSGRIVDCFLAPTVFLRRQEKLILRDFLPLRVTVYL